MQSDEIRCPEPHAEDAALREEIRRLRASLTALLLQKDDLLLIQCRRIEAAYLRRFGPLEVKVYESWCACLRAKRKAKLIRARQNRRERADPAQIEAQLDEELHCYREELTERFRRVSGAMERREGPGLSQRGVRELKDLYRQAVKALHPDLHPDEDPAELRRLQQAMRAYRSGDLETLRAICDAVEPDQSGPSTLEELRTEQQRLRASLRELDRQLEQIKTEYPYSMRPFLENPEQEKAKEAELSGQLRMLRERTERYEAEIAGMLMQEDL